MSSLNTAAMVNVGLIILCDEGVAKYKLVHKEVFEWIVSGAEFANCNGYNEELPQVVTQAFIKQYGKPVEVHITIGSYVNDRAIQAPELAKNTEFQAMLDCCKYLADNNMVVSAEYCGLVY